MTHIIHYKHPECRFCQMQAEINFKLKFVIFKQLFKENFYQNMKTLFSKNRVEGADYFENNR